MREITLEALCKTAMRSTIFRGSRDDWGGTTEELYEALERISALSPNEILKIDIKKRKATPRKQRA